jgi:hypothetical protein
MTHRALLQLWQDWQRVRATIATALTDQPELTPRQRRDATRHILFTFFFLGIARGLWEQARTALGPARLRDLQPEINRLLNSLWTPELRAVPPS